MTPACATGPPSKNTGGSAASRSQPGTAPSTSSSVGRLRTTPTAPSSVWASTSTIVRSKLGSPNAGVATSSRPVSGGVIGRDLYPRTPSCEARSRRGILLVEDGTEAGLDGRLHVG